MNTSFQIVSLMLIRNEGYGIREHTKVDISLIKINKGNGGLANKRTSGDHPNYYITENNQNTENSPGDLKRLAATQIKWKTIS